MNQLLFYQNIIALDRKKHKDLKLTTPISLEFAARTNFIPILLTELSEVAQELPVLFVPIGDNEFALAAITGVEKESNVLIEQGAWLGRYVPAFLRRYPFITLGNSGDAGQFTIAIDEKANCLAGHSLTGLPAQQHALFENDKPGKRLQELIPFLQKFHIDNQLTHGFCQRLQGVNLLPKSDLGVQDKQGKKYQVNGGWIIDEVALKALDPKLIQEFFANDWLHKIYQIGFSIKNFPLMVDRFVTPSMTTSARSGIVQSKIAKADKTQVVAKPLSATIAQNKTPAKTLAKIAHKSVAKPLTKTVAKVEPKQAIKPAPLKKAAAPKSKVVVKKSSKK